MSCERMRASTVPSQFLANFMMFAAGRNVSIPLIIARASVAVYHRCRLGCGRPPVVARCHGGVRNVGAAPTSEPLGDRGWGHPNSWRQRVRATPRSDELSRITP